MKKFIISLCCTLFAATTLMAQEGGAITATLKDATSGEGINGAVVELTDVKTQKQLYYTSGYNGSISIKGIAPATYKVLITYLGYKDYTREVKVGSEAVKLGTIRLKQDAKILEDIQIKGYMGTSQKGDTVSYNASAFKTARDASAEGLLKKMPGITVNYDGSVDAQGENVQKVFVDGKEFFGEDVSTTIKTIPAEMVAKVEVYDKLSDKAEFTGLDDGEGYKALNIVTKMSKRKGVFGKLYGSYGYPEYYSVGGNVNRFNGDEKLSVIAMANNINQLNFSFEDIVGATSSGSVASSRGGGGMGGHRQARNFMVRPMSGISTVQSVGLNYANQWKKLELQGSYFFNHSNTVNHQTEERTTYAGDYTQLYDEVNDSERENWNHRLNLRADYKFSKTQSLMLRANVSLQNYNSWSTSESTTANGDTEQIEKKMATEGNDERIGSNGNIFMLYRTRLGKPGRTLTINGGGNWSTNNSWNKPLYTFTIPSDSTYMRDIERLSSSNSVRGEITYTEPLSKSSQLDVEYEFQHRFSDQNMVTDVFVNDVLNEELGGLLSNISESGYSLHQIGPGFNYSTQKVKFFTKVNYQYSSLDSKQILPQGAHPHYTFQDITYTGNATVNFNKQNMLRLRFRSNTNNPSIDQLQDAITVSGNTYTEGNPDLKPSYSHQFNAFYTNTNIEKGRTFMIHGGVWGSTRAIINSSIMNQPDFVLEKYDKLLGKLLQAGAIDGADDMGYVVEMGLRQSDGTEENVGIGKGEGTLVAATHVATEIVEHHAELGIRHRLAMQAQHLLVHLSDNIVCLACLALTIHHEEYLRGVAQEVGTNVIGVAFRFAHVLHESTAEVSSQNGGEHTHGDVISMVHIHKGGAQEETILQCTRVDDNLMARGLSRGRREFAKWHRNATTPLVGTEELFNVGYQRGVYITREVHVTSA